MSVPDLPCVICGRPFSPYSPGRAVWYHDPDQPGRRAHRECLGAPDGPTQLAAAERRALFRAAFPQHRPAPAVPPTTPAAPAPPLRRRARGRPRTLSLDEFSERAPAAYHALREERGHDPTDADVRRRLSIGEKTMTALIKQYRDGGGRWPPR